MNKIFESIQKTVRVPFIIAFIVLFIPFVFVYFHNRLYCGMPLWSYALAAAVFSFILFNAFCASMLTIGDDGKLIYRQKCFFMNRKYREIGIKDIVAIEEKTIHEAEISSTDIEITYLKNGKRCALQLSDEEFNDIRNIADKISQVTGKNIISKY